MNTNTPILNRVIKWFVFIFIAIILVAGWLFPCIIGIFFPDSSITFDKWLTYSGAVIGVISGGLGVYSVVQASCSEKKTSDLLKNITDSQSEYAVTLNSVATKLESNSNNLLRIIEDQTKLHERSIDAIMVIAAQKHSTWNVDTTGSSE